MNIFRLFCSIAVSVALATLNLAANSQPVSPTGEVHAAGPSEAAHVLTQYEMTLFTPLHVPQAANKNLLIFHPKPGGYLEGKGWRAVIENPAGDWVRVLPNGNMRIDVRLTAKLDDGEYLYVTYGGVLKQPSAESWARFLRGERIAAPEWYYVITPTFETQSKKYAWLNDIQGVGKFVSMQTGELAHVRFDIYSVR